MRHNLKIKNDVKRLRSEGKTYSEIKQVLNLQIPKSTISDWCKDVKLPAWYENKVNDINYKNLKKAQKHAAASNLIKREKFLLKISKDNKQNIDKYLKNNSIRKMLLSILYLGEGAKWKSHSGLILGSSNPMIIKMYIKLLNQCYGIDLNHLKCRISYRADQNIEKLQRYWSKMTSIPLKNFYKTKPDPRTIGKKTIKNDYKGVCVIMGGSTKIQLELELISKLIEEGL